MWSRLTRSFASQEFERPDSFEVKWTGRLDTLVELFAIQLWIGSGKTKVIWRFPAQRKVEGVEGSFTFHDLIPNRLWKSAKLRPTNIGFLLRATSVDEATQITLNNPVGSFLFSFPPPPFDVSTPSALEKLRSLCHQLNADLVDEYSRNNVAFVFPWVNKVLWASRENLVKQSEYFADMFGASGFAENAQKVDVPVIASALLKNGQALPSSSTSSPPVQASTTSNVVEKTVSAKTATAVTIDTGATPEEEQPPFADSEDEEDDFSTAPAGTPPAISRIVIRDVSYKTYRATLYYLATGKISFSHLSSLYPDGTSPTPPPPSSPTVSAVSPKAIYRLSDLFSLPHLRSLAFASFDSQLCANNALTELLSDLSADYAPIREVCMAAVLKQWPALVENGEIGELGRKLIDGEVENEKAKIAWRL